MRQKLRQAIGITSAVALTGSLLLATPASAATPAPDDPTTTFYTQSDFGTESTTTGYPDGKTWFYGHTGDPVQAAFNTGGLTLKGQTQILRNLENATESKKISQNNLEAAINSFEAKTDNDASWHAQIPLFYNTVGTTHDFTTLRPAVAGNPAPGDDWIATGSGDAAAGSPYDNLDEALDAVYDGGKKVDLLAYGLLVDTGKTATIKSVSWNGETSAFQQLDASYADKRAAPGTRAYSTVTLTDPKDGTKSEAPTGTTFTASAPEKADGSPAAGNKSIDNNTGEVGYRATTGEKGSTVTVPVTVHWADGSTSETDAKFNVRAGFNTLTAKYADTAATPGVEVTSPAPTFTSGPTDVPVDMPEGTKFAYDGTAPTNVSVDADTGEVTYKPVSGGAAYDEAIPVEITYPDGTEDVINATFNVGDDSATALAPTYADKDAAVGTTATSTPTFTDSDDAAADAPEGTKFTERGVPVAGAEVNEDTGAVTYTPTLGEEGSTVTVKVKVTYPDTSTDNAKAKFIVKEAADVLTPSYADTSATAGSEATSAPAFTDTDGETVDTPTGSTFAIDGTETGATIDSTTGDVTFTPNLSDANSTVTVPVVITYPDTTTDSASAKFNVADAATNVMTPSYTAKNVFETDVPVTSAPSFKDTNGDAATAPAGTKYSLPLVDNGQESGDATINEDTGVVTFTAASGDRGTTLRYTVKVDYPDGSTKNAEAAFAVAYIDVVSSNQFAGDIAWLSDEGITTGFSDGTFRPGSNVTRQAMAAFVYRAEDGTEVVYPMAPFTDVDPSSQFYNEINWAFSEGITNGYPDHTYRPGNDITREAMAAFLYRAADGENSATTEDTSFSDISDSPFKREIKWLADNGISTGYPDGTFRPKDKITRQAMAAFLHRMDEKGLSN